MQLLNPVGLWFLMSLPVIIALYLLKRRYQEQIVSSNYLWEVILKDIEANTPWQRLKKNWLMILQLIVASLLILAICRPLIPLAGGMDRHVIAVLDCSSSMLATDVKPTRFQEAQEQIQQAIDGLGPGELMTIISMGEQPDVLISASRDKTQLKNALKTAEPGLGSADLESAMAVASSIGEQKANSIIIIFSDGNTRPVEREISSTCPVEFRQIGEGNDNVGFITFAARQQPLGTALLARVRNYSDQEIAIDIELRVNEHLVDVKPVVLRPGETKEQIWTELGSIKGVITAAITRRDSFSLDNTAATVVEETGNPRVLLATKGNIYMEKVLLLFKGLETYKTSAEDYSPDGEEYGLYIYDGFIPPLITPWQCADYQPSG
jgi:Ca-activated chloride channel family protein